MQVKKFEGFSMNEVMASIKAEFGPSAVIIKTDKRPADPSNIGVQVYEVTAAVTEKPKRLGAYVDVEATHVEAGQIASLSRLESKVDKLAELSVDASRVERLEYGLQELKTYIKNLTKQTKRSSSLESLPQADDLCLQLETMGLEEYILSELQAHLLGFEEGFLNGDISDPEFVKNSVIKWLFKGVSVAPEWTLSQGQPAIHALLGPSGSGKTSFAAKLASNLLKQNSAAKIALFAYDHTKLISCEQSRLYSKILGISFEDVSSLSDLTHLLRKHRDKDLILIDIAGHNPKCALPDELRFLDSENSLIRKHLVLSTSEKLSQLDRSVQRYAALSLDSLIFTKLDETWAYGDIFNICKKWSLPLSYFSVSQDISKGIERASKERVVERILGL